MQQQQQHEYIIIYLLLLLLLLPVVNCVVYKLKKSIHINENLTIGSQVFDLSKYLIETQLIDDYGFNSMSRMDFSLVSDESSNNRVDDDDDDDAYFTIDSHTGIISVKRRLDALKSLNICNHIYCNIQLMIQVETNSASLPQRYSLSVYIHRSGANEIKFEKSVVDFDVNEEESETIVLKIGSVVAGYEKVKYELEIVRIVESRHDEWDVDGRSLEELKQLLDIRLVIEGAVMLLNVSKPIDREVMEFIELKLSMSDIDLVDNVELLLSTISIRLNIIDRNDNAPLFSKSTLKLNIQEDVARMTKLIEVKAIDKDSGLNGLVTYRLLNESRFFYLNPKTGFLFLVKSLDYENKLERSFLLIIQAHDNAENETERRQSNCSLLINVLDVNDNKPMIDIQPVAHTNALASSYVQETEVFYEKNVKTENQYQFIYLTLATPFDTVIANIRVKDIDSEFNGYIDSCLLSINETDEENSEDILPVYLFDKMNDQDYFSEKFYELRTNMVFEGKFQKSDKYLIYSIVIRASDYGQLKSDLYLQLIVINTNYDGINLLAYTSYSSFYEFNYKIYINENNKIPTHVPALNMDKVKSLTNRSVKLAKLRGANANVCSDLLLPYLQVNPSSGDIILNKRLDRELCARYDFLVEYFRLNLTINLSIYVDDVNDNKPEFVDKEYKVSINRTSLEKSFILRLRAQDDDLHAKIFYRLDSGSSSSGSPGTDMLSLNEINGELLIKNIDAYTYDSLNVSVRAIDAENPDYFDRALVQIRFNEPLDSTKTEAGKRSSYLKGILKTKSFKFIVALLSILVILLFIVLIIIYYLINDDSSTSTTTTLSTTHKLVTPHRRHNEVTINRDFKLVIDRDLSDLFETSTFNRTAVNSENVSQDSKCGGGGGVVEVRFCENGNTSSNTLSILNRNESVVYDTKTTCTPKKEAVFELYSEAES